MTSTSRLAFCAGTALLLAIVAQPASAAPPRADGLRAAALGPIVDAPNGRDVMELVRFDENVKTSLLELRPGDSIRVESWPVAPGERAPAVLTRFDVYAPDARIVAVGKGGLTTELPRSQARFFKAVFGGDHEGERGVFRLESRESEIEGTVFATSGLVDVGVLPRSTDTRAAVRRLGAERSAGPELSWTCGQQDDDPNLQVSSRPVSAAARKFLQTAEPVVQAVTRTAVIAVDTDFELLNVKFAGSTVNATTYIANVIAGMTVIYERDAGSGGAGNGVRILQGYTILRTDASDPWVQPPQSGGGCDGCSTSAQLNEVAGYWDLHYDDVRRALVMMLSGKGSNAFSASGIAFVPGLCSTASGYSFSEPFKFADQTASQDMLVLAHEVGHNFGSPHTHSCSYGPNTPVDRCVAWENQNGSCTFPGAQCPASATYNGVTATGTLMSYCHLSGLSGCGSALVFHNRTITEKILPTISGQGACLATVVGGSVPAAPTVSGVAPPSGVLAGGGTVTITGTNFANGATVTFVELPSNNVFDNAGGGTEPGAKFASPVTFNSSTSLTATVPSAANPGLVDVIVQNPDQQTGTLRNGYTYTAAPPAPTVTAVTPNFGPAASTTPVTITGTGFAAGPSLGVTFGGTAATGVAVSNATTITATAPVHATGLVNVVVTNGDGQTGTLTNGFFYAPAATATLWHPLTPCRVLDTRNANGPLGGPALVANGTRSFTVTGTCGVPVSAKSVTVNYTVTQGTAAGELRAFAGDALWTGPSVISFKVGATKANNGHLLLSTNGAGAFQVTNASAATIHFILDVNGYYE